MSRGPGRIERAIRELLDAHPDLAFVTDELVEHCFLAAEQIERKQQVSVLRAAFKIVGPDPDWTAQRINGQGGGWVFFNLADVQSYTLGRIIAVGDIIYRSEKRALRRCWTWVRAGPGMRKKVPDGVTYYAGTRAELLQRLPSVRFAGIYAKQVAQHIAYRDGDTATRTAMDAKREAERQAWLEVGRRLGQARRGGMCFQAPAGGGNETLKQDGLEMVAISGGQLRGLAETLRGLLTQNDPDAVRAGLVKVAAALDAMDPEEPSPCPMG